MSKRSSSKASEDLDQAPRVRIKDIAGARFRVGLKEAPRKQRISIMLDSAIIAFFKAKAGDKGYQTLINEALKDAVRGATIEDAVRLAVREEMARYG